MPNFIMKVGYSTKLLFHNFFIERKKGNGKLHEGVKKNETNVKSLEEDVHHVARRDVRRRHHHGQGAARAVSLSYTMGLLTK